MGLTHNFKDLIDRLEELERKAKKEISTNALNAGADILLKGQLETVPEDTGKLKSSLDKGKIKGTGSTSKITVGIESDNKDVIRYGFFEKPLHIEIYVEKLGERMQKRCAVIYSANGEKLRFIAR